LKEEGQTMAMHGEMSDKIRAYAERNYVEPARRNGRQTFAIPVRDVLDFFVEKEGLPRQNVPQICQALRTPRKFLNPHGLMLERVDGPEKQQSPTVVFHYRFVPGRHSHQDPATAAVGSSPGIDADESSEVARKTEAFMKLRGLLREDLAEFGGGEAFLRWLRTDPDKDRR
jgi:hypothetical protein